MWLQKAVRSGNLLANEITRLVRGEEARELAKRARGFKIEKGRLPDINSPDAWEKRMAEGVAVLARHVAEERAKYGNA